MEICEIEGLPGLDGATKDPKDVQSSEAQDDVDLSDEHFEDDIADDADAAKRAGAATEEADGESKEDGDLLQDERAAKFRKLMPPPAASDAASVTTQSVTVSVKGVGDDKALVAVNGKVPALGGGREPCKVCGRVYLDMPPKSKFCTDHKRVCGRHDAEALVREERSAKSKQTQTGFVFEVPEGQASATESIQQNGACTP